MERWRVVWRDGFLPSLPTAGLRVLRQALVSDDPRLHQGRTTTPIASPRLAEAACEGACALGFCGWRGGSSVGAVDEFVNRACWEADDRLGEPAACRWFLNWFDETPREQMRRGLLAEVDLALALRSRPAEPRRPAPTAAAALGMAAV